MLQSENLVRSATTWMETAVGIMQVWFNYFAASVSRHLAYTFPGRLRRDMSRQLVHSLLSPLCIGIITPVCQSFGGSPEHQVTWHTQVSQRIVLTASATVMISSSKKCISCVYDAVMVTGFKRSLKYRVTQKSGHHQKSNNFQSFI